HACVGTDRRVSVERIARVLAQLDADLVALQELDCGRRRTGFRHQAQEIASLLQMHHHFHPSISFAQGRYGNAVLSRFPLQVRRTAPLPGPPAPFPGEPRAAIWVSFQWQGREVHLINTHLGLLRSERARQVAELLGPRWLGHPECRRPQVLCGDFNFTPRSAEYRSLAARLGEARRLSGQRAPARTWPGAMPLTCLDHVFLSEGLRVLSVQAPRNALTRVASDHLPLVVEFQLSE
ncbi:MAG TPA: endonuclease/exonuclease/phosphatase family protein, partial [Candidatus Nitrosotenuis sp.]|nr:endonuclease/exonuclease/phosphatase family protein [Candidatus Nitrosotenuis sp.]